MEIDCLSCYGGKIILDIEGNAACENCGVEVPPMEYQAMFAVSANNPDNSKALSYTSYRKKHLAKVDLLVDTIKNDLQLNDGICQDAKYLYNKAYSQGYPCRTGNGERDGRHFYLTECVGACIYLAALSRGKKYQDFHDRKKRSITTEQVQNTLNKLIQIVLPRYKRQVERSRIERCARLMVKELGLQIIIPDSPIPIYYNAQHIRNQQRNHIESAIVDIADNLGVTKCVSKALSMFESSIRRKKIIDVTVNGHKRKPEVVAGAFIYLAAKRTGEKVTLKSIKKVAHINHESLQKILRLLF
jgi:transcription initiation factor TFIIIB Brf1 subunit/transcription initiation factor TFIIB